MSIAPQEPNRVRAKNLAWVGAGLLLGATVCNEWVLTYALSSDGEIPMSKRLAIWNFQIVMAATGLLFIVARNRLEAAFGSQSGPPPSKAKLAGIMLIVGAAFSSGYVGGASGLHATLLSAMLRIWPLSCDADDQLGLPDSPEASTGYADLNKLLDTRLRREYAKSDLWSSWMDAGNSLAAESSLDGIRTRLDTRFPKQTSAKVGLNPRLREWFQEHEVNVSIVEFQTESNVELMCVLLIPRKVTRPAPCIIVLHGMNGNAESVVRDTDYHHGFAMELARNGFVVLAPLNPASSINTLNTLYIKSMAAGLTIDAIHLQQLQRAVDYALSLDLVDDGHVGVYGISLGGQYALRLGAMDERLSLVVCSGYFTDRFSWLYQRRTPSASSPPGTQMTNSILPVDTVLFHPRMSLLYDDLNLVALIQPRFFCVVSGIHDPRYEMARQRFVTVEKIYEHAGHPERARMIAFDGGHETRVREVIPFLRSWANSQTDH